MRIRVLIVVAALTVAVAPAAFATDGYFSHGYGTESKAMAGAGVALPLGPMSPATNPAAIVFGDRSWDLGIAAFNPNRGYEVIGQPSGYPGTFGLAPGTVDSGSPVFPNPHGGITWKIGRAAAFGLMMYGNGGMNTTYESPTFGVAPAGVNLSQMFIGATFAAAVAKGHAIGVTPLIGYQRFEAKGLQAFTFLSSDPANLTNNGVASSMGGGVRIGYLGQLSPAVSVGASYQTRIWMGKFDKYAGLFAEQGDFDVPSNWTVGVAIKAAPAVDVVFDVQQIRYSEVKSVGNVMLPNLMLAPLGDAGGAGFGWDNMMTYKGGVQFQKGRGWTWRAGYSYGKQPIPTSEVLFNILAPGVMEQHATFGFSREAGAGKAINFSLMRAFSKSITGANPLEVPGVQQIKLTMNQWEFEFGYSAKF